MISNRSVLLLGRQPLFVAGMRSAFCSRDAWHILETVEGETALQAVARLRPDAVLLELGEGAAPGLVARITEAHPQVRLIVLAASDRGEEALRALEAGAAGYLTSRSTPQELLEATRLVLEGETFVSPTTAAQVIVAMRQAARQTKAPHAELSLREEQIATHLLRGNTNREIAASLGLREKTVKHYMTLLMQKFEVRNRLELALHLRQRGPLAGRTGPEAIPQESRDAIGRGGSGRTSRQVGFSAVTAA